MSSYPLRKSLGFYRHYIREALPVRRANAENGVEFDLFKDCVMKSYSISISVAITLRGILYVFITIVPPVGSCMAAPLQ